MPSVQMGQREGSLTSLPMTLDQSVPAVSMAIASTFVTIAAAVLLAPFGLIAELAAFDPAAFLQIAQHPATAIQLALALVIGIGFVAIPLRRLLGRARAPRRIVISESEVIASNRWLAKARGWKEPLASYKGVAHHVRTTLSGAQHEIVLIHDQPSKSVVLHIADRIGQPQVDAVAALLNVSEISPREMYRRTRADARPDLSLKAA
jgi:hypothetical protein